MLPYETWKPQNYPPSSAFPYFGAAPGQLPPQFKQSEHLQAMMARKAPVTQIMKDRADQEYPMHTPYRSMEPSEISEMPALETVEPPEPVPAEMPPYRRYDRPDRPAESTLLRTMNQAEVGGRAGMAIGNVAGHMIGGSLALAALGGGVLVGTGLGVASVASHIYGALPGRSSSDDYNEEVTPPDTQPTRARVRVETAGPVRERVRERVQAIETQVQAQAQPKALKEPEHYDIAQDDEEPPPADPPTRWSRPRGSSGGFFGLFGRPQATAFAY